VPQSGVRAGLPCPGILADGPRLVEGLAGVTYFPGLECSRGHTEMRQPRVSKHRCGGTHCDDPVRVSFCANVSKEREGDGEFPENDEVSVELDKSVPAEGEKKSSSEGFFGDKD